MFYHTNVIRAWPIKLFCFLFFFSTDTNIWFSANILFCLGIQNKKNICDVWLFMIPY